MMLGSVGLLLLLLAVQAAGSEGRSRLTLRTTKTWSSMRPQSLKSHSCQEDSVGQEVLLQGEAYRTQSVLGFHYTCFS